MISTPEHPHDPAAEFSKRLAARRLDWGRWRNAATRVSNLRLAVFAAGLGMLWGVFGANAFPGFWLAIPILVFIVMVVVHDRQIRRRDRAARSVAFYEAGEARLEGRWMGDGSTGESFRDAAHPYAIDLDVFGDASMFQLLSRARTRAGERTLATWLAAAAPPETVFARQAAVAELAPMLDLREDLSLIGADVAAGMAPEALRDWGDAPSALAGRGLRIAALALALGTVAALFAWWRVGAGPVPVAAMLLIQSVFALRLRARVKQTIESVEQPCRDLALFSQLLERIECEEFESPRLVALKRALDGGERPASKRIVRLMRTVEFLDARRNQFFAAIGATLLWSTQLALAIEHWRATWGPGLGVWIDAVGEIEALASLAGFHYENPDSVFPDLVGGGAAFAGVALAHPLLPATRRVANDLEIESEPQAMVVSGSNMSGKSTLLRTVGANAVLALAGGAVIAECLRIGPVVIGASIRIQDSLLDGSSHFYAEIKRLRQIMDLAEGAEPLLFLVDEILHGTNSHDRGIGAAAVLRGFVTRNAIGLVTTHDLSLADVADSLSPRTANVHFEDQIENGEVTFDFRLRPGVVAKSNALELMRAVGLEVELEESKSSRRE